MSKTECNIARRLTLIEIMTDPKKADIARRYLRHQLKIESKLCIFFQQSGK